MTATIFDLGAVPAIVPDMDEQSYHLSPGLSSTGARTLLRNAAKFDYDRTHPVYKDAFDVGSAVHTKVLGKGWDVAVLPYDNWQFKAAREKRDAARAAGRIPLLRKDFEIVEAMAESVLNDRRAKAILEAGGMREASLFAEDYDTGVAMRARPDVLQDDRMADLKTAASAADDDFALAAARFGYQVQERWYQRVRSLVTGQPSVPFAFIVVEKTAPYLVNVIELDAEFQRIGIAQVDRALALYAECSAENRWPGYESADGAPNLVGPPAWLAYAEGMEF